MIRKIDGISEEPQVIGLKALAFLANDEDNLNHFMAITGLDLQDIKERADDPLMLGGILDHFLHHENLLMEFATSLNCKPELIVRARYSLPGATHDS